MTPFTQRGSGVCVRVCWGKGVSVGLKDYLKGHLTKLLRENSSLLIPLEIKWMRAERGNSVTASVCGQQM